GVVLAPAGEARLGVLERDGETDFDALVARAAALDLPVRAFVDAARLLLDLLAVETPLDRIDGAALAAPVLADEERDRPIEQELAVRPAAEVAQPEAHQADHPAVPLRRFEASRTARRSSSCFAFSFASTSASPRSRRISRRSSTRTFRSR